MHGLFCLALGWIKRQPDGKAKASPNDTSRE